jgi:hypothetical protein
LFQQASQSNDIELSSRLEIVETYRERLGGYLDILKAVLWIVEP